MKNLVKLFLIIMFVIVIMIGYVVLNDTNYQNRLERRITTNTEIHNISYINEDSNYYIVKDDEYLYLIDKTYNILLKKELYLIHENKNNYDIIYIDDDFVYVDDYIIDNVVVYEYYDLYTYEYIKKITLGGDSYG